MIEAPSLLWHLDALLAMTDFVSVGTNDLMQYLFAADRGNPRVSQIATIRLSPPALRALQSICEAGVETRDAGFGVRRDGRPPAGSLRLGRLGIRASVDAARRVSARSSGWCCRVTARPRNAGWRRF